MKMILLNAKLPYIYNTSMSRNCVNRTPNPEKSNALSSIWLTPGLLMEENFMTSTGPRKYASHRFSSRAHRITYSLREHSCT